MKPCCDRFSEMSTAIQVTAIYTLMSNGKFHIFNHIPMPNLDSIFVDPNGEDAMRASSFARSNLNAEIGFKQNELSKGWTRNFWLQIYKLEKCELPGEK